MKIKTPRNFLTLARMYNIPPDIAAEIFIRKEERRSPLTDRVIQLFSSKAEAQKALSTLFEAYRDNSIVMKQDKLGSEYVPMVVTDSETTYLAEARKALEFLIGKLDSRISTRFNKTTEKDRHIVIGDLHGLFCDEEAFLQVLKDPAKICFVVGDITDFISISKYRTTIDYVTPREELADIRSKLEVLSANFEKVYYITGNHDKRILRKIQDTLPALAPFMVDPIALMAVGLTNIQPLKITIPTVRNSSKWAEDYSIDFAGQYGDAFFGHFDNFCGPDAPKALSAWLDEMKGVLKLPVEPKVIFQGHSHSLNMAYTASGKCLVSTGCLARPMPYIIENHGKYRPPVQGYVAFYQKDGVTDLGRTQLIPLMNY